MSTVRIDLRQPAATGEVPAAMYVQFRPTARQDFADHVTLPRPFSAALDEGVVTVELAATGAGWCWEISEQIVRYVAVPESAEVLEYATLTDVDPATLIPVGDPPADVWALALSEAVEDATTDAAASALAASGSADSAVASAGTATTKAWEAAASALAASGSADTASAAKSAAEGARDTLLAARGAANGVAPLDSDSRVPDANLPTRLSSSSLSATIEAAIAASGGGAAQVTTLTLPESPTEGQSVTVLADETTVIPGGVTWDSGGEPVVSDRLLITFVWSGVDWVGTYGLPFAAAPDVVAPTAGALSVTAHDHDSIDLLVTGASDETALAAAPYSYSSDNGATWSAYQAGATYVFSGLAASTTYTLRHRVKDAAGNVTTGAAITQATDAAPADSTPPTAGTLAGSAITSTGFTLTVSGASDETALHATPYSFSTDNGATWSAWQASASYAATGLTAATAYQCKHRTRDAADNTATGAGVEVTTGAGSGLAATFLASYVDPGSMNTYTFPAADLGPAAADRSIVVAIHTRNASLMVTSVGIGGVAATIDAQTTNAQGQLVALAHAKVPTGTSGNIIFTVGSGSVPQRGAIGVWRVTGAPSLTAADTATAATNGAALTVTAGADGLLLAASTVYGATAEWANATEGYDTAAEILTCSGALATTSAGDVSPACTWGTVTEEPASVAVAYVAGS